MIRFTARQPVFNRLQRVVAYELLHRESMENRFPEHISPMEATSKVLVNAFLDTNIDVIGRGKSVLINFPEEALAENFAEVAPNDKIVLEILETVKPTLRMLEIFKKLSGKGYRLALDDFNYAPEWKPFLKYVNFIKFDIQATPLPTLSPVLAMLEKEFPKVRLLAEKVETHEEFRLAKSMGFHYFQGYFFAKPEVIHSDIIDISKSSLMNIYMEVMKPDFCEAKLSMHFQCDLPLCVKLLKYVNTAHARMNIGSKSRRTKVEISSIRQAILFLGQDLIRRFVCLLVTSELSSNKPAELLSTSIYRARFCENIVKLTPFKDYSERAFMTGLFSTLDAILDRPMEAIMSKLPIDRDIKLALVQNVGLLSGVINIVKAYEQGKWLAVDSLCDKIDLDRAKVGICYQKAIEWERDQIKSLSHSTNSAKVSAVA